MKPVAITCSIDAYRDAQAFHLFQAGGYLPRKGDMVRITDSTLENHFTNVKKLPLELEVHTVTHCPTFIAVEVHYSQNQLALFKAQGRNPFE